MDKNVKKADKDWSNSHAELVAMIENVPLAMLLVDEQRKVHKANRKASDFSRLPVRTMEKARSGEALRCVNSKIDARGCGFSPACADCLVKRSITQTFKRGKGLSDVETDLRVNRSGKKEDVSLLINTSLVNVFDQELALVCIEDITKRKAMEKRILHMSLHDNLTGIGNRHYFDSQFKRLAKRKILEAAVVMIDINDLKVINDTFGHEAGDKAIKEVARIIFREFRSGDVTARIGGDEFCVIMPKTSLDEAEIAIARLKLSLDGVHRAKQSNDRQSYQVRISAGTAYAQTGKDLFAAIKSADDRMYADKAAGTASRQAGTNNKRLD